MTKALPEAILREAFVPDAGPRQFLLDAQGHPSPAFISRSARWPRFSFCGAEDRTRHR